MKRLILSLLVATIVWFGSAAFAQVQAPAPTPYLQLRGSVWKGTYVAPSYLSLVSTAEQARKLPGAIPFAAQTAELLNRDLRSFLTANANASGEYVSQVVSPGQLPKLQTVLRTHLGPDFGRTWSEEKWQEVANALTAEARRSTKSLKNLDITRPPLGDVNPRYAGLHFESIVAGTEPDLRFTKAGAKSIDLVRLSTGRGFSGMSVQAKLYPTTKGSMDSGIEDVAAFVAKDTSYSGSVELAVPGDQYSEAVTRGWISTTGEILKPELFEDQLRRAIEEARTGPHPPGGNAERLAGLSPYQASEVIGRVRVTGKDLPTYPEARERARLGTQGLREMGQVALAADAGRQRTMYLGRSLAVVLVGAPIAYDAYRWWRGDISGSAFAYRTFKNGAGLVAAEATVQLLSRTTSVIGSPIRQTVVFSAVLFVVNEGFLVYEEGGLRSALHSPEFYLDTGVNLGSTGLGAAGFIAGLELGGPIAWITAPAGALVGFIAGSWVGREAVHRMLDDFAPEFLYKQQLEALATAEKDYGQRISDLRQYGPLGQ